MHFAIAELGLQIKFRVLLFSENTRVFLWQKLRVSIIFKHIHVSVCKSLLIFWIIVPLGNSTRREMNGSFLLTFVPNSSCIILENVRNSKGGESFLFLSNANMGSLDMNYRNTSMANTE